MYTLTFFTAPPPLPLYTLSRVFPQYYANFPLPCLGLNIWCTINALFTTLQLTSCKSTSITFHTHTGIPAISVYQQVLGLLDTISGETLVVHYGTLQINKDAHKM